MAAPLSFPDSCRHKCGSELGLLKVNPRLRAYVRLRAGIFIYVRLVQELAFGIKDFVIEKNGQTN